jgi:hypothetical protein
MPSATQNSEQSSDSQADAGTGQKTMIMAGMVLALFVLVVIIMIFGGGAPR